MSNDQPSRRPPAKSSGGGAPMGSTISIVIAVIAVVVGFLILRNINNDSKDEAGSAANSTPSSESSDSTTTSSTEPPPSTTTPLVVSGATVVVANASGVGGAAGQYTTALQSVGFTIGTATNAAGAEQRIDVSKVYYDPNDPEAAAVAASVAQAMGAPDSGVLVATMPSPVPVEGEAASLGDATVLVMLGKDLAGKPLPILAPEGTETTTTTTLTGSPLNTTTSTTVAG
jgi:LytR cell envelope-related transcriptional attenuator